VLESTGTIEINEFVQRDEIDHATSSVPVTCAPRARSVTTPSR
jgi:hypothetical protein